MPDPTEDEVLSPEEITALKESNENLKKESQSTRERLDDASKQLMDPEYLEYLANKSNGKTTVRPKRESNDDDLPAIRDLEELTNTELVTHIVGAIRKDFSKVGDAIDDEFSRINVAIADMSTAREIDKVAGAHPDFWDYKDEIYALAKSNPHLSPTEAYKIVKSDKLAKSEADRTAADKKRSSRAGSERPGGKVATKTTKSQGPRKLNEAFDEAYAIAFGDD